MDDLRSIVVKFSKWLVEQATKRLLSPERERYREEWLADLEEQPGIFSKLLHAIGSYVASRQILRMQILARGISEGISEELRQRNLYKSRYGAESKVTLNVRLLRNGIFDALRISRYQPDVRVEVGPSRISSKLDVDELRRHLKETESKFPLHFLGMLPRGTAAHVFDDDALDLLAEKGEGLSLLDLAGAEVELAKRLQRPVGIVLRSGLHGADAKSVLAQVQPI